MLKNELVFDVYQEDLKNNGLSLNTIAADMMKGLSSALKGASSTNERFTRRTLNMMTYIALKVIAKLDDTVDPDVKTSLSSFELYDKNKKAIIDRLNNKQKFILAFMVSSVLAYSLTVVINKILDLAISEKLASGIIKVFKFIYMKWAKYIGKKSVIEKVKEPDKVTIKVDQYNSVELSLTKFLNKHKDFKKFVVLMFFAVLYFTHIEYVFVNFATNELGMGAIPSIIGSIMTEIVHKVITIYRGKRIEKGVMFKIKDLYTIRDTIHDTLASVIKGGISYTLIKRKASGFLVYLFMYIVKLHSMMRYISILMAKYELKNKKSS